MTLQNGSLTQILLHYGISQETVYHDLSEEGRVLWHNDRLALKIVMPHGLEAKLTLVTLRAEQRYSYFECPLLRLGPRDLSWLLNWIQKEPEILFSQLSTDPDRILVKGINGQDFLFEKI